MKHPSLQKGRPSGPSPSPRLPTLRRRLRVQLHKARLDQEVAEGLLGLAERLERPDPVNPCGVARVLVLLTDAMGPLYEPAAADRMSEAVWWIADGLSLDPGEAPGQASGPR